MTTTRTKLWTLTVSTLATLAACLSAHGQTSCTGGYCYRQPARVVYYRTVPAPVVYQAAPAVRYAAPAAAAPTPVQWAPQDDPASFLAALNLWRSWHGRAPVGWDAGLAALAAGNRGVHDGTPNQCWSSNGSLLWSLEAWKASPAHAAILLNATVAVGASRCPSGATCNAR